MSKRRAAAFAVGAVVVLAVAVSAAVAVARPRETLSIARISLPMMALLYIADARGYFEDERLDVSFTDFTTGREALDSALAGHHDLAIAYTTPVVHEICAGRDLLILSTLHQSDRNTAIVARRDRGITVPTDLRGKTVGVTRQTSGEFFLYLFLVGNGLEAADLTIVDVPVREMPEAIRSGRLDAAATWNPYLQAAGRALGEDQAQFFYSDVYLEMSLIVGDRRSILLKEEAVRRLVRALGRAEDFWFTEPEDARRLVAAHFADLTPDASVWKDFTPHLGLDHVLLLTLEQEAGWVHGSHAAQDPIPALRSSIRTRYLRMARPESVTLPPFRVPGAPDPGAAAP